jgi:hypothetical protein
MSCKPVKAFMATSTFLEDTGDTWGHDDAILQYNNKVLTSTISSNVIKTKYGRRNTQWWSRK